MRVFFLLTRIQLLNMANALAPVRTDLSQGRRRMRMALTLCGFALLAILMMGYMAVTAIGLASLGLARILPALAVGMGSLAGIAFTFIKTNGTLFGNKDLDLLMSLPVSRRAVVASRMSALAGGALALALSCMAPLYIVYFLAVPPHVPSILSAVVTVALAPLAPTALAALAAYGITWLAARFRHANLAFIALGMAGLLAFVGGSFVFSAQVGISGAAGSLHALGEIGAIIEGSVTALYPPAMWAAKAITDASLPGLTAFVTYSLGVTAICFELMQRRYLALNAALVTRARGTRTSQPLRMRTQAPFWAIVGKELRTLLGIPTYAFNCLFGYLFTVGTGVLLSVMGMQELISSGSINGVDIDPQQVSALMDNISLVLPWVFSFCGIMCTSSVMSVSIEGRSAWLMATAPVSTRTMLGAKLASSALPFCGSLAIAIAILLGSGEVTPVLALECLLAGLGGFALWVCLGMSLDVRHPNFTWMNPQDVVKRGAPVNTCILGGLINTFAAGAASIALSFACGTVAGHAANLVLGVASLALGALVFRRTVRAHPSLYA